MFRHSYLIAFALVLIASPMAGAQEKRRVYVLHSGMHVILAPKDKDHAARTLKVVLAERGINKRDLVALDSPFPTASWNEMVPKGGLVIYLESTDPKSRSSQEAYVRLDTALKKAHVTKNDDLVWIGHSAGGQIGMTMAHLAHNHDKYPDLKKTQPYHFDTIVTLGSAVGSNPTPADVKLRHYCSDGDTMVYLLSQHGDVLANSMKSKVRFRVCVDPGPNCKLRMFPGIEHPEWYGEPVVLDRILRETDARYTPPWRRQHADTAMGVGLGQLLAQALEKKMQISLEEDR